MLTNKEREFLELAVDLAEEALNKGDQPFGSILVSKDGEVLFKDHNRISSGDNTKHPELRIAQWASLNLPGDERKEAVVYTSGEHCPMCAAAHSMNGLGKIVYATSGDQFRQWQEEFGVDTGGVKPLGITDVTENIEVIGPVKEFEERVKALHKEYYRK